jgi:hypothetical protein
MFRARLTSAVMQRPAASAAGPIDDHQTVRRTAQAARFLLALESEAFCALKDW